eukprot:1588524-Amphidinium_carterae.3
MSDFATILCTISHKSWQAELVAKGDACTYTHDIRVLGCCGLGLWRQHPKSAWSMRLGLEY